MYKKILELKSFAAPLISAKRANLHSIHVSLPHWFIRFYGSNFRSKHFRDSYTQRKLPSKQKRKPLLQRYSFTGTKNSPNTNGVFR